MRRLHWSSTSLGYMKPSTPGIVVILRNRLSSHRPIQIFVVDLGLRGHIGLEHFDLVLAQERVHWVFGIFEIDELPGAGGAVFAAGGSEPLGDAVVAEGALVDGVLLGMEVAAAVGARLHAVAAA